MHSTKVLATALCLFAFGKLQAQGISTAPEVSEKKKTITATVPAFSGPQWLITRGDSSVLQPGKDTLESCLIYEQYALYSTLPKEQGCGEEWVPVREDLYIHSKWLTMTDYYSVWDSQNLNSYNYDIKNFKDSVELSLFGKEKGEHWHLPVESSKINSKYGVRRYRWHHGVDIDLTIGDPIYAAFDGIVRISKYNRGGYGNYVVIRHANGLETLYGHLDESLVKEGQEVKAGMLIGLGGNTGRSTGPHLHFEVRYRGHSFNPCYVFNFEEGGIVGQSFTLTPEHYSDLVDSMSSKYHKVRNGDSLGRIAMRYGTSVKKLCQLNGISTRTLLRIGRSLRVR